MAFHPDGRSLLTAGAGPAFRFWDARSGAALGGPLPHPPGVVPWDCAISPDGKLALAACWSLTPQDGPVRWRGKVLCWDAGSGAARKPLIEMPEQVESATFVRGGQGVLVASSENVLQMHATARLRDENAASLKLRVLDAVSGELIRGPFKLGKTRVDRIAVSPDGRRVLTSSPLEKCARLWDLVAAEPLGPPLEHPDQVQALAFSPDGLLIATGCKDNVARLWDAATGAPRGQPMVHNYPVVGLAFSPDGKTLLTRSTHPLEQGGEVRLWDTISGQSLGPARQFSHGVTAIAFCPDGQAVAAASGEQDEISVWRLPAPASEAVERLRLRFQVWTGMELHDVAAYRPLDPETWLRRKQALDRAEREP